MHRREDGYLMRRGITTISERLRGGDSSAWIVGLVEILEIKRQTTERMQEVLSGFDRHRMLST
jgi:hypothetical protein